MRVGRCGQRSMQTGTVNLELNLPHLIHSKLCVSGACIKCVYFYLRLLLLYYSHCSGPGMVEGSSDSLVKDAIVSVLYDTSGPQVNVKGISQDLVRETVIDGTLEQRILSQQADRDSQHILAQHLHNFGTLESVKLLCRVLQRTANRYHSHASVAEKLDKACGFSSLPAHSHEVCFGHTIGFGPTQLVYIGIELVVT